MFLQKWKLSFENQLIQLTESIFVNSTSTSVVREMFEAGNWWICCSLMMIKVETVILVLIEKHLNLIEHICNETTPSSSWTLKLYIL